MNVTKGACAPPDKIAITYESSGPVCNQTIKTRIVEVGSQTNPVNIYYMSNGVCMDASAVIPSYDFYSLGQEVPLSTYVSMPAQ